MAIEKLSEFAKDGQKNTDDLTLTDGFPVSKKPARQWFNWLFNTLTLKINEIIEADYIRRNEIVDGLTTNDATKPVSAKQAKFLNDNKLGKTENAATATKLATARSIGGVNFDGTANINLPGVNTAGNQNTTGNAASATKLATPRAINGVNFDGTANINLPLFGVGQTYQDLTSSRVESTTYTNSTGKTIFVIVQSYGGNGMFLLLFINGKQVATTNTPGSYGGTVAISFPVLNGGTYSVQGNVEKWWEVR